MAQLDQALTCGDKPDRSGTRPWSMLPAVQISDEETSARSKRGRRRVKARPTFPFIACPKNCLIDQPGWACTCLGGLFGWRWERLGCRRERWTPVVRSLFGNNLGQRGPEPAWLN